LLFSKPRTPQKTYCYLEEITNKVSEFFSDLFSNRQIELIIDISQVKDKVFLDPNGIIHCLTNLLLNSGEAVPEKKGIVKIEGELSQNKDLIITVSDNGKGIPSDDIEHIFEPFFTTKGYRGTGLGLSVTKKIVEEHGGDIHVVSEKDKGTKFIITLPQSNTETNRKETI